MCRSWWRCIAAAGGPTLTSTWRSTLLPELRPVAAPVAGSISVLEVQADDLHEAQGVGGRGYAGAELVVEAHGGAALPVAQRLGEVDHARDRGYLWRFGQRQIVRGDRPQRTSSRQVQDHPARCY